MQVNYKIIENLCKDAGEKREQKARVYRIHNQIRKAMLEGKKQYYYRPKDKKIIELYIKENGNTMEFIEAE